MAGHFILSLDCEGKWGVADHLEPAHHATLTEARLRESYAAILALLARYDIAATFAFVGCFALSKSALLALPHREMAARLPFTAPAFADLHGGTGDGWSGDWAVAMVGDRHEIACHGITHTPMAMMDADQVRYELGLLGPVAGQTYIFPRNQVGHLDALAAAGITGYRLSAESSSLGRLASEFNPFTPPEPDLPFASPQPIPAGHFINWLSGARKLVPVELSRLRARRMLERAAATGRVVHFWSHPENMASAPATLAVLEAILQEVARLRDAGRIIVETQAGHVARLAGRRIAA